MAFLVQLKLALLSIHFIAWPAIALGYPLFASIRAIETDSKYHLRKLVIYWSLFSLVSIFEFAFVKIIEWIPFWSSIKLIAIFWLAIPRFHGACYAYQSFIRPWLVANLQEVVSKFEEQRRMKETFLDVADEYIKENGLEALEKLIANKRKRREPDNSERDTKVTESDEKNAAPTSKESKEPVADRKDNEMLEATEKSAAKQPVTKETYAAALLKYTMPHEPMPENKRPSTPPPLKKIDKQEWRCHLCQVTTSSENNLNDHLRGQRHKSMCMSLKSSKLNAMPSSSSKDGSNKQETRKKKPEKERVGNQQKTKDAFGVATQHWCFLCDVEIYGSRNLASHLKGKRHMTNVDTMAKSEEKYST